MRASIISCLLLESVVRLFLSSSIQADEKPQTHTIQQRIGKSIDVYKDSDLDQIKFMDGRTVKQVILEKLKASTPELLKRQVVATAWIRRYELDDNTHHSCKVVWLSDSPKCDAAIFTTAGSDARIRIPMTRDLDIGNTAESKDFVAFTFAFLAGKYSSPLDRSIAEILYNSVDLIEVSLERNGVLSDPIKLEVVRPGDER